MKRLLAALFIAASAAAPLSAAETAAARPELSIKTLDGKTFNLADHKGNWVILNFWATWCSPCIKELPELSNFVKAHKNVRAIGLAYEDTDVAEIKAFLEKHPVVFPIAQVDTFDPPKSLETPRGLPTTYLIAPDGSIAKKFTGPVDEAALRAATGLK
ncbi:TlpA family protein disulfide reductase [Tahibacter harae]|uniref:TlpA family protein disulfide reductase n=1 Tax=Tahibacter harae TaxID=2963937 RepID=A0ABT1QQG8_9GAMM|nr:TlpA disulfide reductase family protein [Tahibacter harae]MCQ4164517.1 TlpA family protein disulfide reductase [Tahibacter harae]